MSSIKSVISWPSQQDNLDPEIYQCKVCRKFHPLRFCKEFLKMTIDERSDIVRQFKYCPNCLARTHDNIRQCSCPDTCKLCKELHHTLLHKSNNVANRYNVRKPIKRLQVPDRREVRKPVKRLPVSNRPGIRKPISKRKNQIKELDEVIKALNKLRASLAPVQRGRHV